MASAAALARDEERLRAEASSARATAANAIGAAEATSAAAATASAADAEVRRIDANVALETAAAETARQEAAEVRASKAGEERAKLEAQLALEQTRRELLELRLRAATAGPYGGPLPGFDTVDELTESLFPTPRTGTFETVDLPVPVFEPEEESRFGGVVAAIVTIGGIALLGGAIVVLGPKIVDFVRVLLEGGPDVFEKVINILL